MFSPTLLSCSTSSCLLSSLTEQSTVKASLFVNYYTASSASGQDEPNRARCLATRAGKMEPSCPLGTTRSIPQAKFHQNSVKMAGYWPRSFFASSLTSTSSRSINTQKKNLANIQPSWPHTWSITHTYYISSSVSGQDDLNCPLWLATRAGKMEQSCPLGTTRCIPQAKLPRKPYHKSFIDQVFSVKMAGYWPRSFFVSLWTSTSSPSLNTQKKNLANIQSSWPHTWSITHTYWALSVEKWL